MKLTWQQLISLYNSLVLLLGETNVRIVPDDPLNDMDFDLYDWVCVARDEHYAIWAGSAYRRKQCKAARSITHLIPSPIPDQSMMDAAMAEFEDMPFGK